MGQGAYTLLMHYGCPGLEKLVRNAALVAFSTFLLASCGDPTEPEKKNPAQQMVEDANRLCSELTATGTTTQCAVKGQGMTVDVRIDTNGPEALKICTGVVESTAMKIGSFRGRWQLRIFSPFSEERPIATCVLQ